MPSAAAWSGPELKRPLPNFYTALLITSSVEPFVAGQRRSIGGETTNALIAVVFLLRGTGMGQDVAMFLWAVLASAEWLADRYAGWLFKRLCLAIPPFAPSVPA